MKRHIRHILVCLFCLSPLFSFAQTLTQYEYWFDGKVNDKVTVSLGGIEQTLDLDIPTKDLDYGMHQLFFRARRSDGQYSSVSRSTFFKLQQGNYDRLEYWLDGDRTNIKKLVGTTTADGIMMAGDFDLTGATEGVHRLYYRATNADETVFSAISMKPVMVKSRYETNAELGTIVKGYYSIDEEEPIYFTDHKKGSEVTFEETIDMEKYEDGAHTLSLSFADDDGNWTDVDRTMVTKNITEASLIKGGVKYKVYDDENGSYATVIGYVDKPVDVKILASIQFAGKDYPVKRIEKCAFLYCKSMKTVSIPESIEDIGQDAFMETHSLKSIYCYAKTPPEIKGWSFDYEIGSDIDVYIPHGAEEAYRKNEMWNAILNLYKETTAYAYNGLHKKLLPEMKEVKAVTADGLSQLFIEVPHYVEQKTMLSPQGKLLLEKNSFGTLSEIKSEEGMYGYIYTAPADFAKSEKSTKYTLLMTAESDLEYEGLVCKKRYGMNIDVYRPGLVLVHGLNSNGNCFLDYENYLCNQNKLYSTKLLYRVNYEKSNKDAFETNNIKNRVVEKALEELYHNLLYKYGIVSSSYDLVGHSMGGILSRLYAQQGGWRKESVHKIITVDTPHWGSQLGDLADKIVEYAEDKSKDMAVESIMDLDAVKLFAAILMKVGCNVYKEKCQAVSNLAVGSEAIANLGRYAKNLEGIPVHAICCVLEEPLMDNSVSTSIKPSNLWDRIDYEINNFVYEAYENEQVGMKHLLDVLFGEKKHDGVVGFTSQKGGLDDSYITELSSPFLGYGGFDSFAHHCTTTSWSRTHNKLTEKLFDSVDSPVFDKNGFKEKSSTYEVKRQHVKKAAKTFADFKSPTNPETHVKMRQRIEQKNDTTFIYIDLDLSEDITKNFVFSAIDENFALSGSGATHYVFALPGTYSDDIEFYALARTNDFELVSDSLTINVPEASRIVSIDFEQPTDQMLAGQNSVFDVVANWHDGSRTFIIPEFTSSDEKVATVEDGMIKSISEGTFTITATYKGMNVSREITVLNAGVVSIEDIQADTKEDAVDCKIYNRGKTLYICTTDNVERVFNISVYDINGQLIDRIGTNTNGGKASVQLNLPKRGIYIVNCVSNDIKKGYKFCY